MKDRYDMMEPVLAALRHHGGSATLLQVSKYIWAHYERDISKPDFFYIWQYEMRHAASELRKAGKMKDAKISPRGVWELA